jgi:translation machinery-associated protein 16
MPPPCQAADPVPALDRYIRQNEEELAEIKKQRRAGRPPTAREELLKFQMAQLETEYQEQGFYVPDITNPTNVALLARWDGSSWPFLVNVAWANITAAGQVRPAKFPPSGNNGAKN